MENYRWRTKAKGILNSRENIDPSDVGKIIKKIADEKGKCTPSDILEVARPQKSVLHPMFEWDDRKASEAYRKTQARVLIRSIQVVRLNEDKSKAERKTLMIHVPSRNKKNQEEPGYITIEKALNDRVARASIVEMALKQLQGMRVKYGDFTELEDVWQAIDRWAKQRGYPVYRTTEEDRKKVVNLQMAV